MFYHLFNMLQPEMTILNVFRYITFRTICASLTALTICFVFGPWVIRLLGEKQIGQYIRKVGPKSHQDKAGTPTMGGVLILLAIFLSVILWVDLTNLYIWIILFVGAGWPSKNDLAGSTIIFCSIAVRPSSIRNIMVSLLVSVISIGQRCPPSTISVLIT